MKDRLITLALVIVGVFAANWLGGLLARKSAPAAAPVAPKA